MSNCYRNNLMCKLFKSRWKISFGLGRNNASIPLKITCTISLVKTQARSTRSNSFNVSTTIPGRANRACNTKWGIWNANFLPSIRHILWLNERQKSDHFYYEENNSYLKTLKGKRGGNHLNLCFFCRLIKNQMGLQKDNCL